MVRVAAYPAAFTAAFFVTDRIRREYLEQEDWTHLEKVNKRQQEGFFQPGIQRDPFAARAEALKKREAEA